MRKIAVAVALVALSFGLAACAPAPESDGGPYDVVIENGRVVDGTGAPWFRGDVAIEGDRIVRVEPAGLLSDARAERRVDATGMAVAPGFIDIHGQSDDEFLGDGDGRLVSKLTQGITTVILGEGSTPAPVNEKIFRLAAESDGDSAAREEYGDGEGGLRFSGPRGFDAWLRAMEAHGASPNVGSFLGAGTIRAYAMGGSRAEPDAAALDTMRAVTRRAMRDGAFGVASALIYPPGSFAGTDELVEIAEAMAPYGGLYITHMRSEANTLVEATREALEIGRRGGVPVEIYHLKAAGQRNWPKMDRVIGLIDSARAAGQDVQANMYPYRAGATSLSAVFPPWASAEGRLMENLRDPETREKIHAAMTRPAEGWENLGRLAGPDGVMVVGLEEESNRKWNGTRLSEIASDMGTDWADAAIELVSSEGGGVGAIYFLMSEENLHRQMRQSWIKWGTDASGMDPDSAEGGTHPRAYGTYPRIMGRFVREEGVIPLEEAVRKATSAVATRLGLEGRGVLKEGMYADVVVFDPERIIDRATYRDPHRLSEGVAQVWVNGEAVVRDGEHTGALPGRILRGPGREAGSGGGGR